jgi:hypothetical protein
MLMHAGLLTRHHIMVLATPGASSLTSLAGVICRGGGSSTVTEMSDLSGPAAPSKSDIQGKCPICLGLVAAAAILAELFDFMRLPDPASERVFIVGRQIAERIGARLPPSRAPPSLA